MRTTLCFFNRRPLDRFDLLGCNQPANIDLNPITFRAGVSPGLKGVMLFTRGGKTSKKQSKAPQPFQTLTPERVPPEED
jgi:hypothetical protein